MAPDATAAFVEASNKKGVPARKIGVTGGSSIRIAVDRAGVVIECPVGDAESRWSTGLSKWFGPKN